MDAITVLLILITVGKHMPKLTQYAYIEPIYTSYDALPTIP